MFSYTRDKALQPITSWTLNLKTVPESHRPYHKNFLSRIECALGDYTLCLTQTKRKYFFCNLLGIRNEDKKGSYNIFSSC